MAEMLPLRLEAWADRYVILCNSPPGLAPHAADVASRGSGWERIGEAHGEIQRGQRDAGVVP